MAAPVSFSRWFASNTSVGWLRRARVVDSLPVQNVDDLPFIRAIIDGHHVPRHGGFRSKVANDLANAADLLDEDAFRSRVILTFIQEPPSRMLIANFRRTIRCTAIRVSRRSR